MPNADDVPDNLCTNNAPESTIQLGYRSKAFVNTMNLVSCDDSDPTDYPELPTSYYMVTVLTKRHDLLTVGFYNASLAATETLVRGVLKADAKVF